MEKNLVMIDLERYNVLIKAEEKLANIKAIAEISDREYGYSKDISKLIDSLLGIE